MTKVEWLEKNGFNEDEYTYCIVGSDTYSIKEHLKEIGGKYNPTLQWHLPSMIAIGDDFKFVPIKFSDIMEWSEEEENALYKEDAKMIVQAAVNRVKEPSKSEHMGSVGGRLRNITAVLKSTRSFMGAYGFTFVYTFKHGENVLTWFSQKALELEDGAVVDLTGTVKSHGEYLGVKQTCLSRCIIKEVA